MCKYSFIMFTQQAPVVTHMFVIVLKHSFSNACTGQVFKCILSNVKLVYRTISSTISEQSATLSHRVHSRYTHIYSTSIMIRIYLLRTDDEKNIHMYMVHGSKGFQLQVSTLSLARCLRKLCTRSYDKYMRPACGKC